MNMALLVSTIVLWFVVLVLGFLLLGTLRALGLLSWRLEQLEVTTPHRQGRGGLQVGKKALDFSLASVAGGEVALHDFAGRKVLLVFTQSGCVPCHDIAPELNRLHGKGEHQVIVVNNGELEETRKWAAESGIRFPVLVQERFSLSKRYEVFATPFAFMIDEQGTITSKGLINTGQHLTYVLTGAGNRPKHAIVESKTESPELRERNDSFSSREVSHV